MAKLKNIRQRRPEKKFRIPSGVVQWAIVGVVAVVLVVLVVGALSRPASPPQIPLLANSQNDLISMTRMLGDVALSGDTRKLLSGKMGERLEEPDSFYDQRRWDDALAALSKMLKQATRPESAAINAYAAFCSYEADHLDRALQSFRKSLEQDPDPAGIAPQLQFLIGWLFQSRGYQDSAIAYYSRVRKLSQVNEAAAENRDASGPIRLLRMEAANNAGVAFEVLKDTASASEALQEAAALVDTLANPKAARTIRENLARLTGK